MFLGITANEPFLAYMWVLFEGMPLQIGMMILPSFWPLYGTKHVVLSPLGDYSAPEKR